MKAKLVLAILFLCGTLAVNAQNHTQVEKNAKAETEKVAEKLQLDPNQKSLVYRQNFVLESDLARYDAMTKKSDQAKEAIKKSGETYSTNMKNILSEEQYVEFSKMEEKDKRLKK